MTQQMKVSLNQWLIVCASALFGFWGCYQVLHYRVGEAEEKISCIERKSAEERQKVWERFEVDRTERQDTRDDISDVKSNISIIQKDIQIIIDKLE